MILQVYVIPRAVLNMLYCVWYCSLQYYPPYPFKSNAPSIYLAGHEQKIQREREELRSSHYIGRGSWSCWNERTGYAWKVMPGLEATLSPSMIDFASGMGGAL